MDRHTTMINQPHDDSSTTMLQHDDASTTHHGNVKPVQHPASVHVNDYTSSESSNRTNKKRSRNDWEEQEEEESMERSSSSSSSSSSAAPAAKQMRITARLPPSLCTINADVLRLLMTFIQVDDLKNILFVNKFLKGIVCSYLEQLLLTSTFSISEDFSNLDKAFEMLKVLPHLPNYNPKKKVTLKLEELWKKVFTRWSGVHKS